MVQSTLMTSKIVWAGRVLTGLTGVFLLTGGINVSFVHSKDMLEGFTKFGYPAGAMLPIGIALLISSILYLIPRTCVLGAILLTGYLGGAVSTHVRAGDGLFPVPAILGAVIWLALFLRDERLRALLLTSAS